MFKSALESSDSCHGPYSQLNSFRNSNVFSCFLKFCTLSLLLDFGNYFFQEINILRKYLNNFGVYGLVLIILKFVLGV